MSDVTERGAVDGPAGGSTPAGTTDAPPAVEVRALRRTFAGTTAVDGLSVTVERGEVFGLVGPNGAGKTTTLRTLATLLAVESGTVRVYGRSVADEPGAVRERLAYLPDEAGVYETLSGREYLRFAADIHADASTVSAAPEELVARGVEVADLGDRLEDPADDYSRGMTRRLLLARALMTRPDLLVLDEPTASLDVVASRTVRELIRSVPADGERSVVLSSHDMREVEALCDRVALVDDGRVLDRGSPAALCERYGAPDLEAAFVEAVS